jgi:surface polysaccharide O-acyltransferase-like enzyme
MDTTIKGELTTPHLGNLSPRAATNETGLNRTIYIDLLRIAAMFGVIMIHVAVTGWRDIPVDSYNWQIANMYHALARWTVPIFVMISGVFHLRPNKTKVNFNDEAKNIFRKVLHLICAIIFWGILYNVMPLASDYFLKKEAVTSYDLLKIPALIIFGEGSFHLWFLYMLIGLYLLTPIIRCFIENCTKQHIEYFLILFFFIGTCLPLCNAFLAYIPILRGKEIYLPVPELTGYVGYYIAGYYFANYNIDVKTKRRLFLLGTFSLLFTIIGTSVISMYRQEATPILLGYVLPNTLFVSFAIFLFFKDVSSTITLTPRQERAIIHMSKNMFGLYLAHILALIILIKLGASVFMINPLLSIPTISILVMVVSYLIVMIIRKIPVIEKYII